MTNKHTELPWRAWQAARAQSGRVMKVELSTVQKLNLTDLNKPKEFACLYEQVNDLEQIRNAVDEDEPKDETAPYPYKLVDGIQVREIGDE